MKHKVLLSTAFFALVLSACNKKDPDPSTPENCIQDKIEAFKLEADAESIIKILRPSGTLYWFVDSLGDGVEDVLDEQCNVVCITDCECLPGAIAFCDGTHLDFPQETIWER